MAQHSELGASICNRWWNCPGSVRLSRGYANRSSLDARKGTVAHEMAEKCLVENKDAAEFIGFRRFMDDDVIEFTAAMAESVQTYLDDCRSVPSGVETHIEVQFNLEHLGPPAPMFGTADFVAYSPALRKLYVKDYKNGFLHVPATSPQLKYYAIGAALWLGREKVVREVEVTICQPNGAAEAVRTVTYTSEELARWARELMDHAREAMQPDAVLQAGAWCRFCPAAAECPERAREALAVAQIEFAGAVSSAATPPEVRLLTATDIGTILARADMLEGWLKDVRAAAQAELQAGRDIPGWKLVAKRPVRSWKDEIEAAEFIKHTGVSPYTQEVISPAKAEAALAENFTALKTKKARLEAAKETYGFLTQSISSGATLAPEADARPALPAAGSEFALLPAPVTEIE
jgi:hypothetical protein